MSHLKTCLLASISILSLVARAQKAITAFDFESPLAINSWWTANSDIMFSQCGKGECAQLPGSTQCLRIQWNKVPATKPFTWMTDIKIDTFGNKAMENDWNSFKENTWLSFKINTADADSVYLQFIIFTKDEKDKWGSHNTIGIKSTDWKTVKVRLSSLQYENWGKGTIAAPDFTAIIPARIEIGIRSAKVNDKGKVDVRLDNIRFTSYEP